MSFDSDKPSPPNVPLRPTGAMAALADLDTGQHVSIGRRDVSVAVQTGRSRTTLNQASRADLELDWRLAGFVDFAAPLMLERDRGTERREIVFYGDIGSAEFDGESLSIAAAGMEQLRERTLPPLAGNLSSMELVYTATRVAGLRGDQVQINGNAPEPQTEVIEVARPILDAGPEAIVRLGDVTILPRRFAEKVLGAVGEFPLSEEIKKSQALAVTYVNGCRHLYDAESVGLERIQDALAWLKVRSVYGGSIWPTGVPRSYRRSESRTPLLLADIVRIRGLASRRVYIRGLTSRAINEQAEARNTFLDEVPAPVDATLKRAARACARASDETLDAMARVNAIWEALEYYASSVTMPNLFAKADLKAIRRGLPDGLNADKRKRVDEVLARINEPPLLARVRERIIRDKVVFSEEEMSLLLSLRRVRNDSTHGRGVAEPERGALSQAASLVARMLLYAQEGAY